MPQIDAENYSKGNSACTVRSLKFLGFGRFYAT